MLTIPCPSCGERRYTEFTYGGDASVLRPADPGAASDRDWTDYLYRRRNPRGSHSEYWHHTLGCRQWLRVVRDTASHTIESVEQARPREAE